MRPLWTRILIGAVAIFVVGILVVTQTRKGVAKVKETLAANWSGSAELASELGEMRLDGMPVGSIQRFQIRPGPAERAMVVTLAVDDAAAARLADCEAVVGASGDLFDKDELRCAASPESEGYARYGTIVLSDPGRELPLFGRADAVSEFLAERDRADGPRQIDIRADSAEGALITILGADGKDLRIRADSTGASIDIRDQHGRPVFQLQADSTGVRLHGDGK
jgi:hypothetical protein